MRRSRGFALIELLIVIAIIAILALIAIPNLMDAQIRAKVSRTMSDMRSMATAVEHYCADFGLYPIPCAIMASTLEVVYPMPTHMHSAYAHNFLPPAITTPIAYITQLFPDAFAFPGAVPCPEQSFIYYQNWEYTYVLASKANAALEPPQRIRADAYGDWVMFANGPDMDRKDMAPAAVGPTGMINGIYDPTNGTDSNGDIIRTQRSNGFSL
jgi:prepilin-type N-terminal cleavage/methylation domain-containing protein